jgi:hypothetical protein
LPVKVTGLVTAEDSLKALAIVGKWRPWRVVFVAVPALIWLVFVVSIDGGGLGWFSLMVIVMVSLLLLMGVFQVKHRYFKAFDARIEYRQPVTWTFSSEGLLTETIHSKTLRLWNGFAYAKITPELIVLAHHGDAMFNFVPRRLFETEGDWLVVGQLLAEQVPRR